MRRARQRGCRPGPPARVYRSVSEGRRGGVRPLAASISSQATGSRAVCGVAVLRGRKPGFPRLRSRMAGYPERDSMRLGVFLLFFAIILATASSPAAAQLSPPAPPDVEEPGKKGKPPKKEKKPPPGGEEGDPDGEEGTPTARKATLAARKATPTAKKATRRERRRGEEGGTGGEEGGTGGESGSPESGGHSGPGGEDPAGLDRSTNDSGSADEDGPSYLASQTGCSEDCDPPGALNDRVEGDEIFSADPELSGALEDDGLSSDAAADAGPLVLALFALTWLLLLVGIGGGLRALHGRIRGG